MREAGGSPQRDQSGATKAWIPEEQELRIIQSQDDTRRAAVRDLFEGFSITGSSDGLNELEGRDGEWDDVSLGGASCTRVIPSIASTHIFLIRKAPILQL